MQGKITTFFGNDTSNHIGGKFDQIAKKLELPEIIYPSDVRNDLYIVINSGKIFKEKEKIGNIEICLEVCDVKGNVIKGTIRSGISKNIFNMKKTNRLLQEFAQRPILIMHYSRFEVRLFIFRQSMNFGF